MSTQWRRWLLWSALLLLLAALLATAMVLARGYQESQAREQLERETANLVSDIRTGLNRNVQTLQSLHTVGRSPGAWEQFALEVLEQHRELVRLEWRDRNLRTLAQRVSPFHLQTLGPRPRSEVFQDVAVACNSAKRGSAPAYAPSYFWPDRDGHGQELMEVCIPMSESGQTTGFLVATYSLQGVLAELLDRRTVRGRGVALTEVDGTRLALSGARLRGDTVATHHLLELTGHVMMLRLDSPRSDMGLSPWGLTGLVGGLSLLLLGVLGLLGFDMRKRLQAERELAEALAFRKAMENSLVTGLRARNMQGQITYVNPAFCELVNLPAHRLLGKGIPAPYWPPEMVDEYQRRQAVRLAGHSLPREGFESVFMRPDGTRFPVLIIEAALINAQGVQTGWMSAILDLSEQHRVEALSRASQERLQATARLASVGEMASLLSHELNQPLAAIASYATGSLNLIEHPHGPPKDAMPDMALALRRIAEQADRAGKVIKSVTDFVRRRENAQDLVREQVRPDALIQAVMPLLTLQARKDNIRLQVDLASNCPPALCDRTMVEQVLLNLARNGMQAMPPGNPAEDTGLRVLALAVWPVPAPHGEGRNWLQFSVTDHGQGLSDDVAARLFTPFFTTKPEGMGLGLSLCRTVIEQHGGALMHEAAEHRGTVFRFTLPAATESPTP
jgi:two-component system sensor histidine kinase DctS